MRRDQVEPTTFEFITSWAEERASTQAGWEEQARAAAGLLSLPEVALVTRQVARILGDRPLRGVTFGDLARLPATLEATGMSRELARSACREIGGALRSAIAQMPDGDSQTRRPVSRSSALRTHGPSDMAAAR